jgi:hypothetical protein
MWQNTRAYQSPTIPAHTLMLNCCWCLEWITPWWFSFAHWCWLWILTMPYLPKSASSVRQINAQHLVKQNTDKRSLALENLRAWDLALVNGKGKAIVHAVPSKYSCAKQLTLPPPVTCRHLHPYQHGLEHVPPHQVSGWRSLSLLQSTEICLSVPGIFEWMQRSMMRRAEACTESHGGHFHHLL